MTSQSTVAAADPWLGTYRLRSFTMENIVYCNFPLLFQHWGLNLGPCTCLGGALPTELCPQLSAPFHNCFVTIKDPHH